nr:DDE-type integrase/transposase/recombinase [Candidatus Sigynarchaeota archaeon]
MKKRKKQPVVKDDDPIEMAFTFRHQRKWTVEKIAAWFKVNNRTIYRWLRMHADKESRYWKKTRGKRNRMKMYNDDVRAAIRAFKEQVPERSAITVHRLLQQQPGIEHPSLETVRRVIRELGLSNHGTRDRKSYVKFAREQPNDLWQIDFKGEEYFGHLGKLHLLAIIDDCSRFILAARWCTNEDETNVITMLRDVIEKFGLPNETMSDHGAQFKNAIGEPNTRYHRLLVMLGVNPFCHHAGHPQSKGKLERWFGTIMTSFVPDAKYFVETHPALTLQEFNTYFQAWLEWYNTQHKHSALGRKSPATIYFEHPNRIYRPLQVAVIWDSWIAILAERKVSKQNVISIDGKKFILPPGHAGRRVQIHKIEGRYDVRVNDTLVESFTTIPEPADAITFVERTISKDGTFKYKNRTYYVGYQHHGKIARVQEAANGKDLLIFLGEEFLDRKAITDGSVY